MADAPRSINEAARLLGVSRRTIYNMIDRGEISYVMVGRRRKITQEEIDRVKGGAR